MVLDEYTQAPKVLSEYSKRLPFGALVPRGLMAPWAPARAIGKPPDKRHVLVWGG